MIHHWTYELPVRNFATTVVLATVAVILVGGTYMLATISPYVLLGIPPTLLAIAAIVRAVGGSNRADEIRAASAEGQRQITTIAPPSINQARSCSEASLRSVAPPSPQVPDRLEGPPVRASLASFRTSGFKTAPARAYSPGRLSPGS